MGITTAPKNSQDEFKLLKNVEAIYHGTSSGLDILGIQSQGINMFTKDGSQWDKIKVNLKKEIVICLVRSSKEKNTKESVQLISE